jgi:hypothetical protein
MNEVAGYVESPAEKPEDQENRKNRPKHRITFATGEWHFMRVVLWTGSCPQAAGFGEENWGAIRAKTGTAPKSGLRGR